MQFLKTNIFYLSWLLLIASCRPYRSYNNTHHPSAPDYTFEKNWIALPWRHDIGDTIPAGCNIDENQNNAKVDVFYIHPTVYLKGNKWNADLESKKLNKKADMCVQMQGTVFNACARVFAPRYRQAVLKSFFNQTKGKPALDLAYEDVKKAFEYYLANWNKGRPIIIAGHSQGARHTLQLLKDFFDGKELQKQLVAAYPIGMPFNKDELKSIPVSTNEAQTGCYVTWNTVAWGTSPDIRRGAYKNSPCVNPLTMVSDENYADVSQNLGSVAFRKYFIEKRVCDAQVKGGLLWIHKPNRLGFYSIGKSYHLHDYGLFYMNIRANAKLRVETYNIQNDK